jgi:hypothetical protein
VVNNSNSNPTGNFSDSGANAVPPTGDPMFHTTDSGAYSGNPDPTGNFSDSGANAVPPTGDAMFYTPTGVENYTFRVAEKGRGTIIGLVCALSGQYQLVFSLQQNRLLVVMNNNYGTYVHSVPYYLIKDCKIRERFSIGWIVVYALLLALCIAVMVTKDLATGIVSLVLLVLIFLVIGIKRNTFLLTLHDEKVVKIKMTRLRRKERIAKRDFLSHIRVRMDNAVNTGAVYESAITELTLGDIKNGVKSAEKKAVVDEIINRES